MTIKSQRALHAIRQMRTFLAKEEELRSKVSDHRTNLKQAYIDAYQRTDRETFGALEQTVTQRANQDPIGKEMIGDEQFYRGLVEMYARVALVELAIEEDHKREQSTSLRNVSPPRAE